MNYVSLLCRVVPHNFLRALPPLVRSLHVFRSVGPAITAQKSFLQPVTPSILPTCGMKQKGHLKRRCADCYFVMKKGRLYVLCRTHPRHKQMAPQKSEKNTWILTNASQSPRRPW